jgi:hypothetical protein
MVFKIVVKDIKAFYCYSIESLERALFKYSAESVQVIKIK